MSALEVKLSNLTTDELVSLALNHPVLNYPVLNHPNNIYPGGDELTYLRTMNLALGTRLRQLQTNLDYLKDEYPYDGD